MATWTLQRTDTGTNVSIGAELADFRGNPCTLVGGQPPMRAGSTGRIVVKYPDKQFAQDFYPSVCGLRWKQID